MYLTTKSRFTINFFFTLIVEMYKTYFKSHTKYILDRDRDDNKLHEGVKKFHETAKNIAW